MKKRFLMVPAAALLLGLCGCGSTASADVRFPVAQIDQHAQRLLEIMRTSDANADGFLAGSEYLLLGTLTVNYLIEVATKLAAQAQPQG